MMVSRNLAGVLLLVAAGAALCAGSMPPRFASVGLGAVSSSSARNGPKLTSAEDVHDIYQLTKIFVDHANKGGCKFWAEGGTFLCARRNGGLCKWDDDGDFGMKVEDEDCFLGLKMGLRKAGVCVIKWYYGYKIFKCQGRDIPDVENPNIKFPFLDLFMVECDGSGKSYYPRTNWYKKCKWDCADLDDLEDAEFGPITVPVTKTDTYLNRCYGDGGWKTTGKQGKDHASGVEGDGSTFKLTPDLLKPALPKGSLGSSFNGSGKKSKAKKAKKAKKVDDEAADEPADDA